MPSTRGRQARWTAKRTREIRRILKRLLARNIYRRPNYAAATPAAAATGAVKDGGHSRVVVQQRRRPECQITAVVRRGGILPCASCDALRSIVGKGQPATAIRPTLGPVDLLDWVGHAQDRLAAAQDDLAAAVTRCREHGYFWVAIADRFGITSQAAHQRCSQRHIVLATDPPTHTRTPPHRNSRLGQPTPEHLAGDGSSIEGSDQG